MPPHKSIKRVNNTPPTPPQPSPPQMDITIFQAAVTSTITQISTNGASRTGGGTNNTNQGDSQGHPRECSYKQFTNGKPNSFDGSRGFIALTRRFEKT